MIAFLYVFCVLLFLLYMLMSWSVVPMLTMQRYENKKTGTREQDTAMVPNI